MLLRDCQALAIRLLPALSVGLGDDWFWRWGYWLGSCANVYRYLVIGSGLVLRGCGFYPCGYSVLLDWEDVEVIVYFKTVCMA